MIFGIRKAPAIGAAGADAAPPKAPAAAWWMLFILLAFYVMSMVDRFIIAMLVDPIKAELGLGDFQMSLILGPAFALFYSIAGFPFGWAADRFPRRTVIFVGSVFWSIATLTCGFAGSFLVLFAARALVGAGEASLTPSAYSMITDKFPRERLTTALSFYAMGPKLGEAIAFSAGAVLIEALTRGQASGALNIGMLAETTPWRIVFLTLGAFGILASFMVFAFKEPQRKGRVAASQAGGHAESVTLISFLKRYPRLITYMVIAFGMLGIATGALMMWTPSHMTRAFGWTPVQYGPILALVSACGAASVIVKGVIIDWLYRRGVRDAHMRFYTWLLIGFMPVIAATFLVSNAWLFLVLYGITQVLVLPFMLYVSATVQMISPNEIRGRLSAFFLFLVAVVSMGVGPTLIGAMTDYVFRDPQKLGLSLACMLISSVLIATVCLRLVLRELKAPLDAMQALVDEEAARARAT